MAFIVEVVHPMEEKLVGLVRHESECAWEHG